jgi:hypothetical protein
MIDVHNLPEKVLVLDFPDDTEDYDGTLLSHSFTRGRVYPIDMERTLEDGQLDTYDPSCAIWVEQCKHYPTHISTKWLDPYWDTFRDKINHAVRLNALDTTS